MGEKFNASRGQGTIDKKLPKQSPKRRADKRGNGGPAFDWGPGGEAGRPATSDSGSGTMVKEVVAQLQDLSDEELNELFDELVENVEDDTDPNDFDDTDYDDGDEIEVEDPFEDLETEMFEALKITSDQIDLSEFASVVDGQNLSEEFASSAKNIFEAVVVNTLNARLQTLSEAAAQFVRETFEDREAFIVARMSEYLDEAVNEWQDNNEVAIESGIRTDLAENFMANIKHVLDEHYVDLPDDKVDVASALSVKNDELMETVNRQHEANADLKAQLDAYRRRDIVVEVCSDLSETQMAKIYDLVENVAIDTDEKFTSLVEDVRQNTFPKNGTTKGLTEDVGVTGEDQKPAPKQLSEQVQSVFAMLGDAHKR